ncbi:MAG TPA: hypothetical protein VF989_08300 [Polyangiaceae bacterium]|jgi:hypothetical protein
MVGLTGGEWFVVIFVTVAVVSAPWWPRTAEALAKRLWSGTTGDRAGSDE